MKKRLKVVQVADAMLGVCCGAAEMNVCRFAVLLVHRFTVLLIHRFTMLLTDFSVTRVQWTEPHVPAVVFSVFCAKCERCVYVQDVTEQHALVLVMACNRSERS